MDYARFGNAGIEVSRLCLGCMDFAERLDEATAQRVLDAALDHGVNFLDTADAYGRGHNEEVLGRLLKGKRDHVVLTTKLWVKMDRERKNTGGCSRLHIMQAVEDSLRRLQTDTIDLYLLHHPDPLTPVEETIGTLDTLIAQGKIRYWGVSNHYAWQMAHMLGVAALHHWEPLVSIQCRYNILDRVVENETVPFCQRFNIATMLYGPLDRGILTGKYRRGEPMPEGSWLERYARGQEKLTDELFDILDQLEAIASGYGIRLNQLAIAWLLARPAVTSIIMGGSQPEHFEQLFDACDITLAPEDIERIDALSQAYRYGPFVNQHVVQGPPLALNRL
ncbi:aldo/keto reductase [bacterium]|nr:aldo/keto reductase [bacterium]